MTQLCQLLRSATINAFVHQSCQLVGHPLPVQRLQDRRNVLRSPQSINQSGITVTSLDRSSVLYRLQSLQLTICDAIQAIRITVVKVATDEGVDQ